MNILEKPAFSLSVGELINILKEQGAFQSQALVNELSPKSEDRKTLYSIRELAKFLRVSVVTAQKLKNSGRIRFRQIGRKVWLDSTQVLEDLQAIQNDKKKK